VTEGFKQRDQSERICLRAGRSPGEDSPGTGGRTNIPKGKGMTFGTKGFPSKIYSRE
jgi:hypothetical protein